MRCELEECIPECGCHKGEPDLADCIHFEGATTKDGTELESFAETVRMPWTGRAMGERDIAFLAASNTPTFVSVIGPHNAGKTTLLAALFLAICRGLEPEAKAAFSGSYSLSGWQDVTMQMVLDANASACFPLHTPDSANRIPGLLHLRYALPSGRRDLLFADAPGEWFTRWAKERYAEGAQGAEWIAKQSRKHLVVADSEALVGSSAGLAREHFERICGRLADVAADCDVALVWTKNDVNVPAETRGRIEDVFKRNLGPGPVFRTQVPLKGSERITDDPQSLRTILDWLLLPARRAVLRPPAAQPTSDPFLAIGRSRAEDRQWADIER